MKRKIFTAGLISFFLSGMMFASCSSGDDNSGSGGGNGGNSGSSSDTPSVVPDNTDSGNNNNSEPDNIIPGNTGSGDDNNTGSGDNNNSGGDNGGNTGSGDDNNSGSGGNNNGNTGSTPTWKLVFEDNFTGDSSTPDPSKWTLAQKGDKTWNRYMSESYNQAYQKDGYLYLFGELVDGVYKTGGIETRGNFEFTYGQVKCRARFLRQPKGNHTGIWMMPEPPAQEWPRSGEIDIMEHLNDQKLVYETVHFWNPDTEEDDKSDSTASIDNEDFNVYGIIWNENSISFTVNGEVSFTYDNKKLSGDQGFYQYPFVKPFYIILSQSLGGEGTWEGPIDNDELPSIFQIDWIKVWELED